MSRGPGRIERAILAALQAEPDNALTAHELCERIFLSCLPPEKKHRVAVIRAMHRIAARCAAFDIVERHGLGVAIYHLESPRSRAEAEAKLDNRRRYRSVIAGRYLWVRPQSASDLEQQTSWDLVQAARLFG